MSPLGFFHLGNLGFFTAWQPSSKDVSERAGECSPGGGPMTFYDLALELRVTSDVLLRQLQIFERYNLPHMV